VILREEDVGGREDDDDDDDDKQERFRVKKQCNSTTRNAPYMHKATTTYNKKKISHRSLIVTC